MRKRLLWAWLAALPTMAQTEVKPAISVISNAKVTAKADLAVVFMSTRSSAPLAADALEQNKKKVQDIRARLDAMGYRGERAKFTGSRFSPSGQGVYYPGGQRPTGFDVYSNVYVYLEGDDLKDVDRFNTRVSQLVDELSKLGASPVSMPSSMSMGGASVVAFTVKDASTYEQQAFAQALDKARPIADDIARGMKVQITGVDSVSSVWRPIMTSPVNPLEELPYEYLSSSIEEVPVRVQLVIRYTYR